MIQNALRFCVIALLFSFLSDTIQAQNNLIFTSDWDIPNSLVNKIVEDKDGMIWVATEDGLLRYNGSRFVVYRNQKDNPNTIAHNFVRTICTDKRGNVLIGTIAGLQVYRKYTDDFSPIISAQELGAQRGNVNVIHHLKDGDFFVGGTDAFLVHIDDKGNITTKANALTAKTSDVHRAAQMPDGTLWISRQADGVMRVDTKGRVRKVKDPDGHEYNFAGFCATPDGNLYACNAETGLFVYDRKSGYFHLACGAENLLKIRDIKAMPNSSLLCIATDGNGVKFYDTKEKKFVSSIQGSDPFIDLTSQKVHSLYINDEGDIWMALYQKGIFMAAHNTTRFGFIGRRSQKFDLIGDRCVTSIVQKSDGNIWVSTDNGGLFGFNPDLQSVGKFPSSSNPDELPTTLQGLFVDSKDNLWFGSYHRGAGIVDTRTGKCTYIHIDNVPGRVYSIFGFTEDKYGNIWAAAMGNGILLYDAQKRIFRPYTSDMGTAWSNVVFYDSRHDLVYAGTYDGIVYFSPKDKKKKLTRLLPTAVVYGINRIDERTLAFSSTSGLFLLDTDTGKSRLITTEQGLPTNNVYAAQSEDKSHIWISLSSGIVRLNLDNMNMETFTARDGLQGNEFYKNTSLKSKDGRLWFGGISGITFFNSANISNKNVHCNVRVVGLTTEGRDVIPGEHGQFVLESSRNTFTVELATMPLYMTHRVTYSYRLDKDEWSVLPVNQNSITFSNVGSGKHVLYTKTIVDGHESEVSETVIYVEYPWYLSWWALILWLVIIAISAYYLRNEIRRSRALRLAIEEHQKEEELKESKLQFFMNIVHDLRTPITLISSPLQKLRGYGDNIQHQRLYAIMSRNADRLLRLTNQIMDLRKLDQGMMELHRSEIALSPFIKSVVNYMEDIAQSRQNLSVNDHTNGSINMEFDTDSLEKILINLLSNALKYTPKDGSIDVDFCVQENTVNPEAGSHNLVLMVTDTGMGIPDEEKKNVFMRFYQVRHEGKHIKGTGIGLNLVKALVELYQGTVIVTDNPAGKGARFVVTLPSRLTKDGEIVVKEDDYENSHETVDSSLTEANVEALGSARVETRSKNRKSILIVDDDDEIRTFLCEEMAALYNVYDCADGKEALALMNREKIDIVVSDIMMPVMDGIELTRQIRQNVRIKHVPIVLLTAKSSDQDRLEGLNAKADAYVTKPFNLQLLQTLVSNLLLRQDSLRNAFSGKELPVEQIDTPQLQSADERLMERLVKVINENLSNPDLTSEMLASEVGLSRVHLYRKLKELTNQSATNYIRNIRLTKAAELLKQRKATISEVAYLVGYRTPNHFSTAFKDLYGVTPSEYLKS